MRHDDPTEMPTPEGGLNGETPDELSRLYAHRFRGRAEHRDLVWQELIRGHFARHISSSAAVLDLGAGHGEFINNIAAARRYAMDLNPDLASNLDPEVTVFLQDCSHPWPLEAGTLDVVFTSNFFEHLPSKSALRATVGHAHSALRPGGTIIALGPNITHVQGKYWDFIDHHLPLTEASVAEMFTMSGFEVVSAVARFLPYTMSDGRHHPVPLLRWYLRLPFAWRLFGQQFLVIARKSSERFDQAEQPASTG